MPRGRGRSQRHIGERNHEPPESKHPGSGIVCPSEIRPTDETWDNQSEPSLENKMGAVETRIPTLGYFAAKN
ncbi:hypothetical protein TNCT_369181 [Trichonephila clavata]|uniref:Uncharacterized protein n=1 Tax=Trichonephila clavata TaxID=2740835 RepID=A0A8X6HEC7_TRICU|nr:hypothetical protein TNCT_369181 [Trichonephila clavata]